jgi:hypothetical protein
MRKTLRWIAYSLIVVGFLAGAVFFSLSMDYSGRAATLDHRACTYAAVREAHQYRLFTIGEQFSLAQPSPFSSSRARARPIGIAFTSAYGHTVLPSPLRASVSVAWMHLIDR